MKTSLLKKISHYYCGLSGKSNRIEYCIYFSLNCIANFIALQLRNNIDVNSQNILNLFYALLIVNFILVPINAVSTRRLRAIGLNTALIYLNFIPMLNILFRLYLLFKKENTK